MTMTLPKPGELFRSNCGDGPYMARVLRIDDKSITLERWHRHHDEREARAKVEFTLPLRFFLGKSNGWWKVDDREAAAQVTSKER